MKNLLACLAMLAAFNVTAQVAGFQLPYNPDVEPDGYIGVGDVLNLLAMFGEQFSSNDIYTNDDSTHIVMNVGTMTYPECDYTCQFTLPGSWRVATIADAGGAWPEIMNDYGWINTIDAMMGRGDYGNWGRYRFAGGLAVYNGTDVTRIANITQTGGCYCSTHERPKVEYQYCSQCTEANFQPCVDAWLQQGYYPIGSIVNDAGGCLTQAFWRWAD